MGSNKRMLQLLKSTGIYRLDGKSAVEKEIAAYAVLFDSLETELKRLADDCFADTMTFDGVSAYRRLYQMPETLTEPELKALIQKRIAVTNRDFTPEGVRRCMASGGFDVELEENFDSGEVRVTILSDQGAFGAKSEKEAFLQECLPCHAKGVFIW